MNVVTTHNDPAIRGVFKNVKHEVKLRWVPEVPLTGGILISEANGTKSQSRFS